VSPTRREAIKSVAAAQVSGGCYATVNAEERSAVEEPAVLHTARFEMTMFMEGGHPSTLSIESERVFEKGVNWKGIIDATAYVGGPPSPAVRI